MEEHQPGRLTRRTLLKLTGVGTAAASVSGAQGVAAAQEGGPMAEQPKPASNDTVRLEPYLPANPPGLTFDFPGLEISIAEYQEGPTGCTVFSFPKGAACATDVRGGAPGVLGSFGWVHAICLAGGSLYGLEAATGVTAELLARRGYSHHWNDIPLVNGAIVYDFARDNSIYPDKALGRAALRAARPGAFPLGARGAGRHTRCGGAG